MISCFIALQVCIWPEHLSEAKVNQLVFTENSCNEIFMLFSAAFSDLFLLLLKVLIDLQYLLLLFRHTYKSVIYPSIPRQLLQAMRSWTVFKVNSVMQHWKVTRIYYFVRLPVPVKQMLLWWQFYGKSANTSIWMVPLIQVNLKLFILRQWDLLYKKWWWISRRLVHWNSTLCLYHF